MMMTARSAWRADAWGLLRIHVREFAILAVSSCSISRLNSSFATCVSIRSQIAPKDHGRASLANSALLVHPICLS